MGGAPLRPTATLPYFSHIPYHDTRERDILTQRTLLHNADSTQSTMN